MSVDQALLKKVEAKATAVKAKNQEMEKLVSKLDELQRKEQSDAGLALEELIAIQRAQIDIEAEIRAMQILINRFDNVLPFSYQEIYEPWARRVKEINAEDDKRAMTLVKKIDEIVKLFDEYHIFRIQIDEEIREWNALNQRGGNPSGPRGPWAAIGVNPSVLSLPEWWEKRNKLIPIPR